MAAKVVWPKRSGTKAYFPLLHGSEFECLKSAVKFANVVKEIDKAHEQEMLKHVI